MDAELQEYRSAKFKATTHVWSTSFEKNLYFLENFLVASEYLSRNFEETKLYLCDVLEECCYEVKNNIELDENLEHRGLMLLKHTIREIIKSGAIERKNTHDEILVLIYKNIESVQKPKFSVQDRLILLFRKVRYHVYCFLFGKAEK
jgi:hypothetical protein